MIQIGPTTQIGPIEKGGNVVPRQLFGRCAIAKRLRAVELRARKASGTWRSDGGRLKRYAETPH